MYAQSERRDIPVVNNNITVLDGAMGTMLQKLSLAPGEAPEIYQMTHPEDVLEVHKQYVEAGSKILYTNTFGATRKKLAGSGYSVAEVIQQAVDLAKKAAANDTRIALDIGPIGELLEPNGYLSFHEAYTIFQEAVRAGSNAGVDLVVFETMSDLMEVKAAILAAKENCNLPVFVTMSFEEDGKSFTGCSVDCFALCATALGVDALGINCSLGPAQIYPIAKKLRAYTHLPMIIKANAGLPDPLSGAYDCSPKDYVQQLLPFQELGVAYIGGCCGTTPAYIKALRQQYPQKVKTFTKDQVDSYICTSTSVCSLSQLHVIGERINPTGNKRMKQALLNHDFNEILQIALEEVEGGADILDVNVGLPDIDEKQVMVDLIKELQSVVDVPLQIDSTNPKVIEAALRVYSGIPIVNSINAQPEVMDAILPHIQKYGACVVGLTMDESGIPEHSDERLALAKRIVSYAARYGIEKNRICIDCLTLTVSAQQEGAMETLKTLTLLRDELQVNTVLGISNISFGLPNRIVLNQSFLTMALHAGLTMPIMNPNQAAMMNAVRSFRVLTCLDKGAKAYIEASIPMQTDASMHSKSMDIQQAIIKGLKEEAGRLCVTLLETHSPMEIIDEYLIPALDEVGNRYEEKKLYLPQLINAATASQAAFTKIKEHMLHTGKQHVAKGKILLATVKGDVHDIGKNIVKVVLENYGYQVFDLGRDVAVEKIVECAVNEQIPLIGLSALMTTTLPAMEATIKALRETGHVCKIMVGGAVVSHDYAMKIHADYYAKDAKESADIAKEVLR